MDSSIVGLPGMIFLIVGVSGKACSIVGLSGMIFSSMPLSRMGFSIAGLTGKSVRNLQRLRDLMLFSEEPSGKGRTPLQRERPPGENPPVRTPGAFVCNSGMILCSMQLS